MSSASNGPLSGMDPQQLLNLLSRVVPGLVKDGQNDSKEAAAETLSNLSQSSGHAQPINGQPSYGSVSSLLDTNIHPGLQIHEPGPNSHPNGPPSLHDPSMMDEGALQDELLDGGLPGSGESSGESAGTGRGGRRGGAQLGQPPPGSAEWQRIRKDNHKEVERRRRGNINEGINELARIVPNGTGEKAKGAILSRAVQYIHHLKENEARNIEKWTLEKLLMDQAMGDLQAQLEEVKRLWDEERTKRDASENEVRSLKSQLAEQGSRKRSADDGVDSDADMFKKQRHA